jgi:MSHA biogenesis protein MshK
MTRPAAWPRLVLASLLVFGHALAQSAPTDLTVDPTRPPALNTGGAAEDKAGPAHVLQSVLIAPGRSVAVIDGTTVKVGSRVGDAKVVRIEETGVTLAQNGKTEVLMLFPDAKKSGPRHNGPGQRSNEARAK